MFNSIYIKKKGSWFKISNIVNGSILYGFTYDFVLADTTLIGIHQEYDLTAIYYCGINSGFIQNDIFQPDWKLSLSGSYYHQLIVNKNNIYVGAGDGIYLSSNFGVTWKQIGLADKRIYNLVLSGTNLIAQTNAGMFKSFDGGYNWSSLNLSLDKIIELELCGDNLIALTYAHDYSHYQLWKRSFNELITDLKEEQILPDKFSLSQNYPNPFNPLSTIGYQIPQRSFVSLKVYDILGKEVATLVTEEKPAGRYEVHFNGENFSSGIYFYKLQAGNYSSIKKMVLIK